MIDKLGADLSAYRLEKAKDLLLQARILYENQKFDGCTNRSYYAIFNAIRSLLALIRLDSSKHSGVLSFFDKYFVKTGIFTKEFSKIAHSAFEVRQDNDYEDFYTPTEEESQKQLTEADIFIKEIDIKRQLLIKQEIRLPDINK